MTQEIQQAKFEGWAVVDVMGHQRYAGFVTTEAYGQAVLFRIDVPELAKRERVTKQPGYVDHRYVPAGTTVKEGAVAGYTKLIGSGSIYMLSPCSKDAALRAVEDIQPRPLMQVQLPESAQLVEGNSEENNHYNEAEPDDEDDESEPCNLS